MGIDDRTLALASIRDLGRMIRTGEITPTQLAEHAIAQLDGVGRRLNAVVTLTRERALREAWRAAEELRAGVDRGPLHGIPYGAKDLLATAGIPTTWGAVPFKDQVFDHDATVIRKLEQAGAVLVAKLAMVELAGGMGYDHPNASLTGPGLSPWNPEAWSGGSSSGSGSAVGARAVPFAIGSETHGSITTPSAFCGVSGLRPTYGRVSRHGAMALCWTLDKLGPMCRTADDCGLVLDALAGPDAADPTASRRRYRYAPEQDRTAGFRIGVLAASLDEAQPEVRASFEASLDVLREFATLEDVTLPELPYQAAAVTIIRSEASAAFDDFITSGKPAELTAESDRVTPYMYDAVSAKDYLRAMRVRRHISRAMDELCTRYDALVSPTLITVAPPADESFANVFRRRGPQIGAAGNLAGLPAVSVPNGFGERGLPTAIQFVGRTWEENRVLAVARAYQQHTDWHLRLPPLLGL